ncbi:MAG: sulfatase [Zavarzinella sp.]
MNVLFIVSDDLCNAIGCYGHPLIKTPNIDKLAARGVKFERAYCQYPLCNPSRASFLTGYRPDTIRVYDNAVQFRKNKPDAVTLPQTFRKAGYFVARVGKLYHYGVPLQIGTDGLDDPESWEKVVNPRGRDRDDEDKIFSLTPGKFGGSLSWLAADGKDDEQTDAIGAKETIRLLEQKAGEPFFIACGFYRPHTPFVAPKAYFDLYRLDKITLPMVPENHRDSAPTFAFQSYKKEQDKLTDPMRKECLQAYYASTTFMDAQVGRVLDSLERLKIHEKTIVVFISDHGYHLGEHGLWQKQSLFENSARVPMIVYDPRMKPAQHQCGRTVELTDLHPTLADLVGIPAPIDLDGKSMKKLLEDPVSNWDRPALTQVVRGNAKQKQVRGYSIRTEQYRYTEWGPNGTLGKQLYDYTNDPGELTNLANDKKHQDIVAKMQALLNKEIKR